MEAQRTLAQWYSLLAGVFLVALGALSLVTNGLSFGSSTNPDEFIIWKVNGWNAVLWTASGTAGILMSVHLDASRLYAALTALVFGFCAVWGFIDSGVATFGIFAFGTAGNVTHALVAGFGLVVGMLPDGAEHVGSGQEDPSMRRPRPG